MYQMEKITTGVSYTTSAVGTGYWFLQLLDRVSPSQWAAIGVLGSLLFGLLTYLTNLYFKSERTVVRLHGESNSMTQNYELIVKGIRNFENKVTVTLALRDKKTL
ncbi:putative lysis protein S [Escherichia coli]|nr:putative lysis protein S [Escherichia coli]